MNRYECIEELICVRVFEREKEREEGKKERGEKYIYQIGSIYLSGKIFVYKIVDENTSALRTREWLRGIKHTTNIFDILFLPLN